MSNNILSGIEPELVFKYFEEICGIPHGSKHTELISSYLVSKAGSLNLKSIQDEKGNVIIFVPGSTGYENSEPVILQGHMDMVCEKNNDNPIDFKKDGLELRVEGDVITASGTTLGGDDGIALAYGLAIAEDKSLKHPPLELVFTVDEEIGMLGAAALDTSVLQSKTMINLDNEDEGYLLVSCAGGARASCHVPVARKNIKGYEAVISVSGLVGGHSGQEIDKYRANAGIILGRILYGLSSKCDINLVELKGGLQDNAIMREADVRLVFGSNTNPMDFEKLVYEMADVIKAEYKTTDPDMTIEAKYRLKTDVYKALDTDSSARCILALYTCPNGVIRMSTSKDNLVETSLNLGILNLTERDFMAEYCVRSSVDSAKKELLDRLKACMLLCKGRVLISGDYPGWEYKEESKLRDLMAKLYREMYNKEPVIYAMHAGVECGYFAMKIKDLDCVSIGPDLKDIHTPLESMNISSVKRTYEYLIKILENLK